MLQDFWLDLAAWWATVPPEFAFLLALPFGVAALGLLAGRRASHQRRDARDGQAGRPRWLGPEGHG